MTTFADTIFPWLIKLRRADGALVDGQCDAAGNLKVSVVSGGESASVWVDPEAGAPLEHARLVAALGARRVYRVMGTNEGDERRWLMVFDLPRLPIANAQPVLAQPVVPGASFAFDFPRPRLFRDGIAWAVSASAETYTEDTHARFRVHIELA